MKTLLIASAVIEITAGLGLLIAPSLAASVLLASSLTEPVGLVLSRTAGAGLLSLGIACGMVSGNAPAGKGMVASMTVYNILAAAIMAYGAIGLKLNKWGLLPVIVLHICMAVWCVAVLRKKAVNS